MIPHTVTLLAARGGMGKSSMAAGIARAAAMHGETAVLVDFDMSERSLDTLFAVENRVVYDLGDLFARRRDVRGVVLEIQEHLYLIPGMFCVREEPTLEQIREILTEIAQGFSADYIILDTTAISAPSVRILAELSEQVLTVSTPEEYPLAAAASLGARLASWQIPKPRLLVNQATLVPGRHDWRAITDGVGMPLIGVVSKTPHLKEMLSSQYAWDKKTEAAFANIATRLRGGHRPLLTNVSEERRACLMI